MKVFIESTWAPWIPMPATIQDWYAVTRDRTKVGHTDLYPSPEWKEYISKGEFIIDGQNPLDYLVQNTDGTTSLGFKQPNAEVCQKWADLCSTRLRPGQLEHVCVVVPEEGDDPSIAKLSYQARLTAGIIQPYQE